MKIDWKLWKPRLLYGAFALAAFVLALRWTFPAEAVKERIILEAGARGWTVDAQDVGPGGVLGVRARGVQLEDRAGTKIPVEDLTASIELLPLLVGRSVLAFDARLYDGRITGSADLSGDLRRVIFRASGVDLGRAVPLKKATGLDLQGKLAGTGDLVVPVAPNEKPTGRIDLTIADAGIAGGQVPVPGMGGGLSVPKVALGAVTAAVKLEQGKANVERLEAKGGDAELTTDGVSVVLQPRLEFAPLMGKARLRIQNAFWSKSGTSGMKGIAEMALAPSRAADGTYQFQVYGSLGHPQLRPMGANAQ
jgi:type II secretion system protein N